MLATTRKDALEVYNSILTNGDDLTERIEGQWLLSASRLVVKLQFPGCAAYDARDKQLAAADCEVLDFHFKGLAASIIDPRGQLIEIKARLGRR
jgi:hypothetical protein